MGFFTEALNATSPAALVANKAGGGRQDSMGAANQYLNQIPGKAHENADQAQDFINRIMQSYKPSEGYQFQKEELNKDLGNTAAAGGYAGGEYDQDQRGKLLQKLLSGDMQQYLQNVQGAHNRTNDIDINALNQQGGLAFGNAENNNSRNASLRDALLKLFGGIGGAALGGSAGGQAGSSLAGLFGGGGGNSNNSGNNFTNSFNPNANLNSFGGGSGGRQNVPGYGFRS